MNALSSLTERTRSGLAHWVAGLLLAAAGVTVLSLLVVVSNCTSDACGDWLIRLGLPGAAIVSALAQAAVAFGGWLLWRGWLRSKMKNARGRPN
jgi:hypothetical protein